MAGIKSKENIQVFLRVRPINNLEKQQNSYSVIDCVNTNDIQIEDNQSGKRIFTFDRVFGPNSKQIDVYKVVLENMIDEVLAGYNCTVFAYGQTGSGKTYTMEGRSSNNLLSWKNDSTIGIVPRGLSHLFDELEKRNLEARVYVSFLELYNEDLFDLLSKSDTKLKLFEDATRKGAIIVNGLEEVRVNNKDEIYKILDMGTSKRQTAATLLNAVSSRSHTVFSIIVSIQETVDKEIFFKTGKLNLVDLAGSENIGRSGAVERHAREAGNINQSLLTLGRVITALVDRRPHIPYRESKLTRLLQDSLGGHTKTSIIATVSPASINLEESLSTLHYAKRARGIVNKPVVNQKQTQNKLMTEYEEELKRLRKDLDAHRYKDGIFLARDNYENMKDQIKSSEQEMTEKINHIRAIEEERDKQQRLIFDFQERIAEKETELLSQQFIVDEQMKTEKRLISQANEVKEVAETAAAHNRLLHDKLQRKTQIQESNKTATVVLCDELRDGMSQIETVVMSASQEVAAHHTAQKDALKNYGELQDAFLDKMKSSLSEVLTSTLPEESTKLKEDLESNVTGLNAFLEELVKEVTEHMSTSDDYMETLINSKVNEIIAASDEPLANIERIDFSYKDNAAKLQQTEISRQRQMNDISDKFKQITDSLSQAAMDSEELTTELGKTIEHHSAATQEFLEENGRQKQIVADLFAQIQKDKDTLFRNLNSQDDSINIVSKQASLMETGLAKSHNEQSTNMEEQKNRMITENNSLEKLNINRQLLSGYVAEEKTSCMNMVMKNQEERRSLELSLCKQLEDLTSDLMHPSPEMESAMRNSLVMIMNVKDNVRSSMDALTHRLDADLGKAVRLKKKLMSDKTITDDKIKIISLQTANSLENTLARYTPSGTTPQRAVCRVANLEDVKRKSLSTLMRESVIDVNTIVENVQNETTPIAEVVENIPEQNQDKENKISVSPEKKSHLKSPKQIRKKYFGQRN